MADELQALLDRITAEELKRVDQEKETILAQAKAEANEIIKSAKLQADELQHTAQRDADMLVQKGQEALKQAARDMLISLRSEMEKRVVKAVEELMKSTMGTANLADIITKVICSFVKSDGAIDDLKVMISSDEFACVEAAVKSALAENLKAHCEFSPAGAVTGGFKLIFKSTGVVYDFSDKSLAETVANGLSAKLAEIITAE